MWEAREHPQSMIPTTGRGDTGLEFMSPWATEREPQTALMITYSDDQFGRSGDLWEGCGAGSSNRLCDTGTFDSERFRAPLTIAW